MKLGAVPCQICREEAMTGDVCDQCIDAVKDFREVLKFLKKRIEELKNGRQKL